MTRVEVREEEYKAARAFLEETGVGGIIEYNVKDSFSKVVGGVVRVISVEKAKISCILNVEHEHEHGHGHLCLGEITISYLSAAHPNAEVVGDKEREEPNSSSRSFPIQGIAAAGLCEPCYITQYAAFKSLNLRS